MIDKSEGVENYLLLLRCLLETKPKIIRKYFKRNLFFRENYIKLDAIQKLIAQDKNLLINHTKLKNQCYI